MIIILPDPMGGWNEETGLPNFMNKPRFGLFSDDYSSYAEGNCPRCGSGYLVKRVAKKGKNKGKEFLGCSNFPKCKYTKDI